MTRTRALVILTAVLVIAAAVIVPLVIESGPVPHILGLSPPSGPPAGTQLCSGGSDAALLEGPTSAPGGYTTIPTGTNAVGSYESASTHYWLAPGTHVFSGGPIVPGSNSIYEGGYSSGSGEATIDGTGLGTGEAFYSNGSNNDDNVTIEYLTIENYANTGEGGATVGQPADSALGVYAETGWNVNHDTIQNVGGGQGNTSGGSAVYDGANWTIEYNCLTNAAQGGVNEGSGNAPGSVIEYNEISDSGSTAQNAVCGCDAAMKLFDATDTTINDNYVHGDNDGIWPDTNNAGLTIESNYFDDIQQTSIFYENGVNALIEYNTILDSGWSDAEKGAGFVAGSIYISTSGGDARLVNECLPGVTGPCGPIGSGLTANAQGGSPISTMTVAYNALYDSWGGVAVWEAPNIWCSAASDNGGAGSQCTLGATGSAVSATGCTTHTTTSVTGCTWSGTLTAGQLVAGLGIPPGDTIATTNSTSGTALALTSATYTSTAGITIAVGGSANPATYTLSGTQCGVVQDCGSGWTSSCSTTAIEGESFTPNPATETNWYADNLFWNCRYRAMNVLVNNNAFNLTPANITLGGVNVCGAGQAWNSTFIGGDPGALTIGTTITSGTTPSTITLDDASGVSGGPGMIITAFDGSGDAQDWITGGTFSGTAVTVPVVNVPTQNPNTGAQQGPLAAYTFSSGAYVDLAGTQCGMNGTFSQAGGAPYNANMGAPNYLSVTDQDVVHQAGNVFADNAYCGPWSWDEPEAGESNAVNQATWQAVTTENFAGTTVDQDAGSTFASSGCATTPTTTTTTSSTTSSSTTSSTTTSSTTSSTTTTSTTPTTTTSSTTTTTPPGGPTFDGSPVSSTSTVTFSTAHADDYLLALVSADGPIGGQRLTVSGGGLKWARARYVNSPDGTAEIWFAFVTHTLSGVVIKATENKTGYSKYLTVLAVEGTTCTCSGSAAYGTTNAPKTNVLPINNDSLLFANGITRTTGLTADAGDSIIASSVQGGVTFFVVESGVIAAPTETGIGVTTSAAAHWNVAAVEAEG